MMPKNVKRFSDNIKLFDLEPARDSFPSQQKHSASQPFLAMRFA
jgi:hypothetical protein